MANYVTLYLEIAVKWLKSRLLKYVKLKHVKIHYSKMHMSDTVVIDTIVFEIVGEYHGSYSFKCLTHCQHADVYN